MDGTIEPALPRRGLADRLADRIVEHARREGLSPGAHLTEQALAATFQVSRTPVRLALQSLEAQGVVERLPNRGVFLRALPAPADRAEEPMDDDPLYFRIADDYLSGALEPRISETDLLRRTGAPRSQLLRVLARMAREGWVERRPGHGWTFLPVLRSPEAYVQGYRFRLLIEPAALLEPGYRLDAATIARLRAEQRSMLDGGWRDFPATETHRIGAGFHEALIAGSGNPFLIESLRRVNAMRRLLELRIHADRSRLVPICEEHLRILDLIEAGDMEAASAFLRVHLQGSRLAKEPLARSLSPSAPDGA